MADMTELLMKFRTNEHVLLGDLKHAFLQVRLKNLVDRNRFCFFLKEGDKLICYRYKTIIFGYNSSPFILNYILKFVADKFPGDECTRMIKNYFFVDNLVITDNNIVKLTELYKTAVDRLGSFGFNLRSCNSNNETLRSAMYQDGKLVEHGCQFDSVRVQIFTYS